MSTPKIMRVDQQDAGLPMVASKSFFDEAILLRWLVTGILVAGQLAVIGGPPKSLKTSVAIDLALSLGTAARFLGRFRVPHSLRVGLLSGESGKATTQETAKRICVAKGVEAEAADVRWGFDLPRLDDEQDLKKLATTIVKRRLGAVIIDPLYPCAIGKSGLQASNVYEMGSLLGRVTRVCLDAGATPILIHHTKRKVQNTDGILDLGDLSFSGVAEAAPVVASEPPVSLRPQLGTPSPAAWLSAAQPAIAGAGTSRSMRGSPARTCKNARGM